ncbi:MAG: hypothetical protein HYY24_20915 [Verrucomicrobia bacterium]|nr:hypothetical protein [Verrucomicrobiota bacterium]
MIVTTRVTIDTVAAWVGQVVEAERRHVAGWSEPQLEQRLRRVQELELASRLRHVVGGLDVVLAARGPDIQSAKPPVEIQLKCLNYWHGPGSRPQPIPAKQIEKDLGWLIEPAAIPRFCVLFFPRRSFGYSVQRAGVAPVEGRRRFQQCISATEDALDKLRYVRALVEALADLVFHGKTDGKVSRFFQYQDIDEYSAGRDDPWVLKTVGHPGSDLFWAVVLSPVGTTARGTSACVLKDTSAKA